MTHRRTSLRMTIDLLSRQFFLDLLEPGWILIQYQPPYLIPLELA